MSTELDKTQLALWVMRLSTDDEKERAKAEAEFIQWKLLHLEEAKQVEEMMHFSEQMQKLSTRHVIRKETLEHSFSAHKQATSKVKKNWGKLLGLSVLGISTYIAAQVIPYQYYWADVKSDIGEQQHLRLEDGSLLTLAADTAVNFHFDHKQREIELVQGKIMIEVAKDPHRPLVVNTRQANFTALGTRFIVEQLEERSRLSLLHSKVLAKSVGQPQLEKIVTAGQQLEVSQAGFSNLVQIDSVSVENALQQNQLIAQDMPLTELLEQLKRFHRVHFIYNTKQLAHIKVNAVISVKQSPRQSLELIAMQYPKLSIHSLGDQLILIGLD